jgi:hypothetical protein
MPLKLKGERWPKSSFAAMPGAMPRSFKEEMLKKLCYVSKLSGAKLGKNKVGGQVAILPKYASGATNCHQLQVELHQKTMPFVSTR